ncbi:MAG TPA: NAD-dependent epimerase/dehydratase family protein [Vicinamibacterales bacterium]|nr:NAD-dependent epimerase/dehydratase family protein [Vicinamibacterales bacterium]
MSHVLVTGGAGFIGSHLVDSLLRDRCRVTVIDNFDPFYDRSIKQANIAPHRDTAAWRLVEGDIRDAALLQGLPADIDVIVHLAAAAGVRPSIADPVRYQEVNVGGTQNLLELARARGIRQFVFGSSSSVYGVNPRVPWSEDDHVLPISPYASTKIGGELLGHVYSHLHGIRFIALRLFTVYGPRQRPDLAIHKFTKLMLAGQPVPLFGDGSTRRDYTYVADIVAGIRAAIDYQRTPFEIVNLGNNHAVSLMDLVRELEGVLGMKATIDQRPEQPGDVSQTWASIDKAKRLLAYEPRTPFGDGLRHFAEWMGAETARALPRAQ